jgi:hypothetical protein
LPPPLQLVAHEHPSLSGVLLQWKNPLLHANMQLPLLHVGGLDVFAVPQTIPHPPQ